MFGFRIAISRFNRESPINVTSDHAIMEFDDKLSVKKKDRRKNLDLRMAERYYYHKKERKTSAMRVNGVIFLHNRQKNFGSQSLTVEDTPRGEDI